MSGKGVEWTRFRVIDAYRRRLSMFLSSRRGPRTFPPSVTSYSKSLTCRFNHVPPSFSLSTGRDQPATKDCVLNRRTGKGMDGVFLSCRHQKGEYGLSTHSARREETPGNLRPFQNESNLFDNRSTDWNPLRTGGPLYKRLDKFRLLVGVKRTKQGVLRQLFHTQIHTLNIDTYQILYIHI